MRDDDGGARSPAASASSYATVTVDAQGDVLQYNAAAKELLAASAEPIQSVVEGLRAVLLEEGCSASQDSTAIRSITMRDGTTKEFSVSICVLPDGNTIVGMADITHLMQDKQSLATAVSEREQALEQALTAKREFLSNMSHELRTPLNGILGMTDLLSLTETTQEQALYIESVRRSGRDLLHIVNHLLDLAASEQGRLTLRNADFSLRESLGTVFDSLEHLARDKGLAFRATIQDEVTDLLHGDVERVKQIVFNLVGNAIKYTRAGSVECSISPWEKGGEVAPSSSDAGQAHLAITVQDTGPGIPPSKREHIFDAFALGEDLLTKKHAGAGLGLPVTKVLAEMMGGELQLAHPGGNGQGCTFVCRLQLARGTEPAPASSPASLLNVNESCRVLLVEDEEVSQIFAKVFLEKLGHKVDVAENGRIALERLKEHQYDVVLMDLQMPEMDGLTASRRIREGNGVLAPDIPIIALTVFATTEDRHRAIDAGMDEYIAKPVDAIRLERALRRAFARRGSAQALGDA